MFHFEKSALFYKIIFFPNVIHEWNKFGINIHYSTSFFSLKNTIFKETKPPSNSIFDIHNSRGLKSIKIFNQA